MRSKPKLHASRLVALCRLALVLALLVTSLPQANHPIGREPAGLAVLAGFLAFALAMLVIAWRHWWLHHLLRRAAFLVDAAGAFLALYWVERGAEGFISPFMAFYLYLVIAATLLWRPRGAAMAAGLIVAGYAAMGLLLPDPAAAWQTGWFGRRLAFMLVMGGLILWFGRQAAGPVPGRLELPLDAGIDEQLDLAARFAARQLHCTGLAIAWTDGHDGWTRISLAGSCGLGTVRLPPDADSHDSHAWGADAAHAALLFDRQRGRGLRLDHAGRISACRPLPPCPLADFVSVPAGIIVPLQGGSGRVTMLLAGIDGASGDHLRPARDLAREICGAMERSAMAGLLRSAEAARVRLAVARDLHDGVAQSLAGTSFRLEALRQAALAGKDIVQDLTAIQQALAREEGHVEAMIAQLRGDAAATPARPWAWAWAADVGLALEQVADHWNIAARFDADGDIAPLPPAAALEITQIVRECVANAVRHGKAGAVSLAMHQDGQMLQLEFIDNGSGFNAANAGRRPRSLDDRVAALRGTLDLQSSPGQTRLSIRLPMESLA